MADLRERLIALADEYLGELRFGRDELVIQAARMALDEAIALLESIGRGIEQERINDRIRALRDGLGE
jgi:hypothetical protein